MILDPEACQNQALRPASLRLNPAAVAGYRLQWHLQRHGVLPTLRRILLRLLPLGSGHGTSACAPAALEQVLGLKPGELVEVKAQEEILTTLDQNGRHRGLYFMPEMSRYCGRRLRVYKRVERMLLEATREVRKVKHTVLLEGTVCEGVGIRCDRACCFLWREAWLRRVEGC